MFSPINDHSCKLPVADELRLLVRLAHAPRDELQLAQDAVQLPVRGGQRQRVALVLHGGRPDERASELGPALENNQATVKRTLGHNGHEQKDMTKKTNILL